MFKLLIKHPSGGVISAQDDLQHPSGGIISVRSVNYHSSGGICIPSSLNNFLLVASGPPEGMTNATIFFPELRKMSVLIKWLIKGFLFQNAIFLIFRWNLYIKELSFCHNLKFFNRSIFVTWWINLWFFKLRLFDPSEFIV